MFVFCLFNKKTKHANFTEKQTFFTYRFFLVIIVFSENSTCFVFLLAPVLRFALLPHYQRSAPVGLKKADGILTGKILVHRYLFNWWNSDLTFCPSSSTLFMLVTDGFNFWNCFFSFYVYFVSYSRTFILSWH